MTFDPNHDYGRGYTLLMNAARDGDVREVRRLLDSGADVNRIETDDQGEMTALAYAAAFGQPQVIGMLTSAGANVDFQSRTGMRLTPLMHAAMGCDERCVKLLLDAGADRRLRNSSGETAFDYALLYRANAVRNQWDASDVGRMDRVVKLLS
ncbi:MAG: ankyrin repeat domain-containing protein [Planctomycetaceae bacterium]